MCDARRAWRWRLSSPLTHLHQVAQGEEWRRASKAALPEPAPLAGRQEPEDADGSGKQEQEHYSHSQAQALHGHKELHDQEREKGKRHERPVTSFADQLACFSRRQRTHLEHLTTAIGRAIDVHRASPITGKVKLSSVNVEGQEKHEDSTIHQREPTQDKRREAAAGAVAGGSWTPNTGTRGGSIGNARRQRAPHGASRDGRERVGCSGRAVAATRRLAVVMYEPCRH
ncbi:hypothetical protein B296_00039687 [Ensete ventricosum]|uniref:Uncharacterized protein n=1 Tax=Ensete ventricosum TaxID=4639 RepID=A0A426Z5A2_ENSVE|nr:hypothetical protein B296_00039687 [Ensete ventricosum]